jgi:hypothetical protein
VSSWLLHWRYVDFCQKLFLHLLRWPCDLVFDAIYMQYYIYWVVYVEPSLHPGMKLGFIIFLMCCWIWLAHILLKIFIPIFIKGIDQ